MQFLAHVGIALATTCAGWLNALTLLVLLVRRGAFPARSPGPAQSAADRGSGARHGRGHWRCCASRSAPHFAGPAPACGSRRSPGSSAPGSPPLPFWRSSLGIADWRDLLGPAAPATGLTTRPAAAITRRHEPHFFRHPANRQSAPRQLSRRHPQLGGAAARLRVHLLHRRSARADPAAGPGRTARHRPAR